MLLAGWREVEVHSLRELVTCQYHRPIIPGRKDTYSCTLSGLRSNGSRQHMMPRDVRRTQAGLRKALEYIRPMSTDGIDTGSVGHANASLDNLAELLGYRFRRLLQWKRLHRVDVKERGEVDECEHGVELILGVDALRVGGALQGKIEEMGNEVRLGRDGKSRH